MAHEILPILGRFFCHHHRDGQYLRTLDFFARDFYNANMARRQFASGFGILFNRIGRGVYRMGVSESRFPQLFARAKQLTP
jgi:hypothetical protein